MAARTVGKGFAAVRKIALALPDVEEGTSWGAPAWRLRGKLMACAATNKAAEPDSLVVLLDFAQRDELLAAEPDVYYLKDHYVNYPCLLVRLNLIHPDALPDLLRMSWQYVDAKAKRKRPARKGAKRAATRAVIVVACLLGAVEPSEARQSAEAIARAIVVGQLYASGNVYVAGFEESEKRAWPDRLNLVPLRSAAAGRLAADFVRIVVQDSEEQHHFPRREDGDPSELDVFATVDGAALEDRNLARYRSTDLLNTPRSIFGWDERFALTNISVRDDGQLRPTTARERAEVAAEKQKAIPKGAECTTVPQFLDAATLLLTANLSNSNLTIRLSHYQTPGCAGHLAEIYVLDVLAPGREPRRFEFRHYHGVI